MFAWFDLMSMTDFDAVSLQSLIAAGLARGSCDCDQLAIDDRAVLRPDGLDHKLVLGHGQGRDEDLGRSRDRDHQSAMALAVP